MIRKNSDVITSFVSPLFVVAKMAEAMAARHKDTHTHGRPQNEVLRKKTKTKRCKKKKGEIKRRDGLTKRQNANQHVRKMYTPAAVFENPKNTNDNDNV